MCLAEIASTLRSSRCNWKAKGAEEVKCLVVVSRKSSVHRADFALRLWEKASGQILCNNDSGMKNPGQSRCLNLWPAL